jgi:hypothetical protein
MNEKTLPMKYRRMEFNAQLQTENERLTIERDEARRTAREAHEMGARVVAQRDALLAVLKDIGEYTGEGPTYTTPWQDIVADLGQMARAAIAAVEEGK